MTKEIFLYLRGGFCLAVLVSFAVVLHAHTDVEQLATAVDRHYNNLKSMRVEFTQTYSGAGTERTESGSLTLKKPGKMRWEYTEPRSKLFLSDGKRAWFYVPGERQARTAEMKQLDDLRSPLRYLLGHTKLVKEFRGLSVAPDVRPTTAGGIVLRGIPARTGQEINQVLIEVSPASRICRLVIEEAGGSITDFRFRNEADNVPAPDSQFLFTPPAGVEVLRGGELTAP